LSGRENSKEAYSSGGLANLATAAGQMARSKTGKRSWLRRCEFPRFKGKRKPLSWPVTTRPRSAFRRHPADTVQTALRIVAGCVSARVPPGNSPGMSKRVSRSGGKNPCPATGVAPGRTLVLLVLCGDQPPRPARPQPRTPWSGRPGDQVAGVLSTGSHRQARQPRGRPTRGCAAAAPSLPPYRPRQAHPRGAARRAGVGHSGVQAPDSGLGLAPPLSWPGGTPPGALVGAGTAGGLALQAAQLALGDLEWRGLAIDSPGGQHRQRLESPRSTPTTAVGLRRRGVVAGDLHRERAEPASAPVRHRRERIRARDCSTCAAEFPGGLVRAHQPDTGQLDVSPVGGGKAERAGGEPARQVFRLPLNRGNAPSGHDASRSSRRAQLASAVARFRQPRRIRLLRVLRPPRPRRCPSSPVPGFPQAVGRPAQRRRQLRFSDAVGRFPPSAAPSPASPAPGPS